MKESKQIEVRAIEILTLIINRQALHPLDESKIKSLWKALHKRGVMLNATNIYGEALASGWSDRAAAKARDWAAQISSGGRVQIVPPTDWGETTADRILRELHQA